MVRKLATQVPQAVTRLLQAQTITPPVWYQAYLEHPPQSLPPRRLAPVDLSLFSRSIASDDQTTTIDKRDITHRAKRAKTPKLKVPELRFQEDEIRRRFFTDFPFEALRPVSLIEGQTVGEGRAGVVEGKEWTELKQRGDVPTVEDTIAFVINMHEHHSITLSQAYQIATAQFIKLRAIDEIARFAAEEEALAYEGSDAGFDVKRDGSSRKAFDRFFDLETRALRTNYTASSSSTSGATEHGNNIPTSAPLPTRFLFGPNLPKRRSWSPQLDELATSHGKARVEDLDSHGSPMPYSDGLNYVMKWKALKGRGTSSTRSRNRSVQSSTHSGAVEAQQAKEVAEESQSQQVKEEQSVHVQA